MRKNSRNGVQFVKKLLNLYLMNKNVSVWRGSLAPPTHSHLWVVNNNTIKRWDPEHLLWINLLTDATETESGLMSCTDK